MCKAAGKQGPEIVDDSILVYDDLRRDRFEAWRTCRNQIHRVLPEPVSGPIPVEGVA